MERRAGLHPRHRRVHRCLRHQGAQKRNLQGHRCVSPRNLVPHRRAAQLRQGRSVPADRHGDHDRDHGDGRPEHAEAAGSPADRGRDGLQPDVTGDAREYGRAADQEMVPGRLHPVHLHPRLQSDRLRPAAGRLAEHVQALRGAHPVVPDLRGRDERRRPAGACPGCVRRIQHRRCPCPWIRSGTSKA